jgi:hypothetical protein
VCVAIVAAVAIPTAAMAVIGTFTSTTMTPAVTGTNSATVAGAKGVQGTASATSNGIARYGVAGSASGSSGIGVLGTGPHYGVFSNGPLGVAAGKPLSCTGCVTGANVAAGSIGPVALSSAARTLNGTACTKDTTVGTVHEVSDPITGDVSFACVTTPPQLYWGLLFGGTIIQANLDGTNAQTIASGLTLSHGLAVNGAYLYATNPGGTIVRANRDGTNLQTIVSGQSTPMGIVARGGHLYWANNGNSTVMMANLDGTNPQPIAQNQLGVRSIAADATHVYWCGGSIGMANLDGSDQRDITNGETGAQTLAVAGNHLYINNESTHELVEADIDGSNDRDIAATPPMGDALATDGAYLYWTTGTLGTTIVRTELDGSGAQTIASGQVSVGEIAVG